MTEFSRLGSYFIVRTLRRGVRCKVKLGRNIESGHLAALKIFKENSCTSSLIARLRNEAESLSALAHPNILESLSAVESATYRAKRNKPSYGCVYKVLEYCPTDLFTLIHSRGRLSEPVARKLFVQLVDILQYIHSHGICHRNIKLDNLLISSNGELRITGFSFCSDFLGQKAGRVDHRHSYSAPEILSSRAQDWPAGDLYAAGVVLFTLVLGTAPFNRASFTDVRYALLMNDPERYWRNIERSADITEEIKDLLKSMLSDDTQNRLSLEEIKSHPWTVKPVPTSSEILEIIRQTQTTQTQNSDSNSQNSVEITPTQFPHASLRKNCIEVCRENASEVWERLKNVLKKNEVRMTELPERCMIVCRANGFATAFSVGLYGLRKHHVVELIFRRRFQSEKIVSMISSGLGI